MKETALHILLILVIAGSIFFTNLGKAKLWDRDEPRNAGCAVEMMSRGNFIVPTFNNQLRPQKPVLLYWLLISAYKVFGINEFAARFWSAVLGLGTVLFSYGIARRLFNPTTALISAIILSTSIMFDVAARAATPDSVLVFFSTLALLFYVLGTFGPPAVDEEGNLARGFNLRNEGKWFPQSLPIVILMYAAMAMGVLAKGPVGLILPTAIIGMFLLIKRQSDPDKNFWKSQGWLGKTLLRIVRPFSPVHFLKTCWAMRPFTAILCVLVIAAPWFVWVGIETRGDFAREFFIGEHFGRVTTALENHSGGWWFYPLAIMIGFFPWSVFWFATLMGIDRSLTSKTRSAPATLLLLCWVGVQVGLFSLASTKLPSYVTPCYPALSILVGSTLYRWATGKSTVANIWFVLSYAGMIVGSLLMTAALVFVCWKVIGSEYWLIALGAAPLIGGIVALALAFNGRKRDSVFAMSAAAFACAIGLFGFGTGALSRYQQSEILLGHVLGTPADVKVAAWRTMESSWVVYSSKRIYELAEVSQPEIDPVVIDSGAGESGNDTIAASTNYPDYMNPEYANPDYTNPEYFNRMHRSPGPFDLDPAGAIVSEDAARMKKGWWQAPRKLTPEEFVAAHPDAVFITSSEHVMELMDRLPRDFEVVESVPYFLQDQSLLLLARRESEIARAVYASRDQSTVEAAASQEYTAEQLQPVTDPYTETAPPQFR